MGKTTDHSEQKNGRKINFDFDWPALECLANQNSFASGLCVCVKNSKKWRTAVSRKGYNVRHDFETGDKQTTTFFIENTC